MKSEKSFRKSLFGGFNTQDVVTYITRTSKAHREEVEALRAGADKLRRERDALAGGAAPAAVAPVPPAPAEDAGERDELRIQFYEMRKERDALRSELDAVLVRQEGERAAAERFERERAAFENDRSAMLDALTRREQEQAELAGERASWCAERSELLEERQKLLMDLENAGATRERIEREEREAGERLEHIRSQAETARQETAKLIAQSRALFGEMTEKSRASALEVVRELDRMRGFFTRFPERFAEPEQLLAQWQNDPRPFVREFVPPAFEEEENPPPGG